MSGAFSFTLSVDTWQQLYVQHSRAGGMTAGEPDGAHSRVHVGQIECMPCTQGWVERAQVSQMERTQGWQEGSEAGVVRSLQDTFLRLDQVLT